MGYAKQCTAVYPSAVNRTRQYLFFHFGFLTTQIIFNVHKFIYTVWKSSFISPAFHISSVESTVSIRYNILVVFINFIWKFFLWKIIFFFCRWNNMIFFIFFRKSTVCFFQFQVCILIIAYCMVANAFYFIAKTEIRNNTAYKHPVINTRFDIKFTLLIFMIWISGNFFSTIILSFSVKECLYRLHYVGKWYIVPTDRLYIRIIFMLYIFFYLPWSIQKIFFKRIFIILCIGIIFKTNFYAICT